MFVIPEGPVTGESVLGAGDVPVICSAGVWVGFGLA
jgi:hypothetical protein